MDLINFQDLVPVAYVGNTSILFVRNEDKDREDAMAVRLVTDNTFRYSFGLVQNYMKFVPYEPVVADNATENWFYRYRVYQTFDGDALLGMLQDFRDQIEKWEKLEDKWNFETTKLYGNEKGK